MLNTPKYENPAIRETLREIQLEEISFQPVITPTLRNYILCRHPILSCLYDSHLFHKLIHVHTLAAKH